MKCAILQNTQEQCELRWKDYKESKNVSKPLQVSDASQIGAKLRIAVKLDHCSHLANGI